MDLERISALAPAIGAFFFALCLTGLLVAVTMRVCRKYGYVAKPRADRWHQGTPAMFGGVPLWLGFSSACLVFLPHTNRLVWELVGLASLLFALGLVDDLFHLKPRSKFTLQLLAASLAVNCGVIYPLRESLIVNVVISIVWIVGITNAFNLLDNMDGLSAGIALIVSMYLLAFYVGSGAQAYTTLISITAGAIAGFLYFNFNPARIFMGDSGSLFIGFLLGTVSLLQVTHISRVTTLVFAPVVVLAIPIFDTFFVSVTRRLRGQPMSVGGTDHSSHRLVSLGLSERNAVLLLYVLSIGSGAVALEARSLVYPHAVELVVIWYLALFVFGIHLFRENSRREGVAGAGLAKQNRLISLLTLDSLAFLLDAIILSIAYCFAFFLQFQTFIPPYGISTFWRAWPILLSTKWICLGLLGVYRHPWWREAEGDGFRLARATGLGELISALIIVEVFRVSVSPLVFVADLVVSWALLLGLRKSAIVFRETLRIWGSTETAQHRVFVLGTSKHAELAVRFLEGRSIQCAGLIDMNGGSEVNRTVWGTKVVGRLDDLMELAGRYGVSEVVLPEREPLPCSKTEFQTACERDHLRLMSLGLYSELEARAFAASTGSD